ncbi:MAG: hypothetical protein MJ166_05805 [Clostridia bacterium]|nr:hypothetical protein [Clostridia bacterium]
MGSVFYTNGLFGMGQDEGVYQVKALAMSEGEQRNTVSLEAEDEFLKSTAFFDDISEFNTYADCFFPSQLGFIEYNDGTGIRNLTATFHGTTAYPSLLAFDVELFGIDGMMNINYALVFISFVFLLEIVDLFDLNKFFGSIVLLVGICSPTTIWTNKSALTEAVQLPLLIAIVCGLILASKHNKLGVLVTTIATMGYSALHLRAFYVLPIIGVMLILNYIRTKDVFAIICNVVISIVYVLIFRLEAKLYPLYVHGNLTVPLNQMLGKSIDHHVYVKLVVYVAIGLCLLSLMFLIPPVRKLANKFINSIIYSIFMLVVMLGIVAAFFYKFVSMIEDNGVQGSLNYLAIYGVLLSTGYVMLPLVVILGSVFIKKIMQDSKYEVAMISFIYFVLFLSTFIHPLIGHYYYYSRYFSSHIFCVPLVFAVIFNKLMKRRHLGYFAGVTSILAILPFMIYVSSMRDDTFMTLEQFEDYTACFNEGDAVVFSTTTRMKLLLPTKYSTDADVYDVPILEPELNEKYNNVYYVCWDTDLYTNGELYASYPAHNSSDPQYIHNYLFPLFDIAQSDRTLCVYSFDPNRYSSNYTLYELRLDGFNNQEGDYVWSSSPTTSISFYVTDIPDNTLVHINFSPLNQSVIPKQVKENNHFTVYVDDEVVYSGPIKDIPYECTFSSEYLTPNADNTITIEFDTWVPADYIEGSTDTRQLGFATTGLSIK